MKSMITYDEYLVMKEKAMEHITEAEELLDTTNDFSFNQHTDTHNRQSDTYRRHIGSTLNNLNNAVGSGFASLANNFKIQPTFNWKLWNNVFFSRSEH